MLTAIVQCRLGVLQKSFQKSFKSFYDYSTWSLPLIWEPLSCTFANSNYCIDCNLSYWVTGFANNSSDLIRVADDVKPEVSMEDRLMGLRSIFQGPVLFPNALMNSGNKLFDVFLHRKHFRLTSLNCEIQQEWFLRTLLPQLLCRWTIGWHKPGNDALQWSLTGVFLFDIHTLNHYGPRSPTFTQIKIKNRMD